MSLIISVTIYSVNIFDHEIIPHQTVVFRHLYEPVVKACGVSFRRYQLFAVTVAVNVEICFERFGRFKAETNFRAA